jgi:GAF domain-containing protein
MAGEFTVGTSTLLLCRETLDTALRLLTALARESLIGTAGAGVTVLVHGRTVTTAASDPLVERADGLQYGLDEGPCLTALREGVAVRVDEMRTETRWPRWTGAVAPLGMRSSLSSPMVAGGVTIGAIKVYSRDSEVYDEHAERVLALCADQAALLLGCAGPPAGP